MKQISRPKAKRPAKQSPTHIVALTEMVHDLEMFTIVYAWEHKVHNHVVCWQFRHTKKGIVNILPSQIKILKKIRTKRTSNVDKRNQRTNSAVDIS